MFVFLGMTTNSPFSRKDIANRIGDIARFRAVLSSYVITEEPIGYLANKVYHRFGELYMIDIDSSIMTSDLSFSDELQDAGNIQQIEGKVMIDEEDTSLSDFFKLYENEIRHENFFVEITLNNAKVIYCNHIRLKYRYQKSNQLGKSNQYELELLPAKRISYPIRLIDEIIIKQTLMKKQSGQTVPGHNIFVNTIAAQDNYQFLVGETDIIEDAKLQANNILYKESLDDFFVFVRIRNSPYYEVRYVNLTNEYSQIITS